MLDTVVMGVSFVVGLIALMTFMDTSPAEPSFAALVVLSGAYGVGVVSAVRLMRSGRRFREVLGGLGLVIQSLVMLAVWLLVGRM